MIFITAFSFIAIVTNIILFIDFILNYIILGVGTVKFFITKEEAYLQGHIRNLGTNKAPKWQYLFYIYKDGKRKCITKSGFQKKSEANKALRLAIKQYEDNNYVDNTRITFREIAEEYIEEYIKENRKANTYAKYKSQYTNYLEPLIGDMKITNINARTINSTITKAKKMNPNKPLSNTSLQTLFTLMSSIFNRAIKHELLVKNPCTNADRPRRESIDYEILSMEEINILLNQLNISNHFDFMFASAILITIETGLRRGELAGLTWNNIHLDNNSLTVKNTILYIDGHTVVQESPKSEHSFRTIYFSNELKELFIKLKEKNFNNKILCNNTYKECIFNDKSYDFVFRHLDGTHVHPMWFYNRLQKELKKSNINKKLRWHDLRHTSTSLYLMNGADITTISQRIGHYSPEFTLKTYSHVNLSHQKNVVDSFSSNLPKILF